VQPRGKCRVASKRTESFECPDEGFLGELPGEGGVAREPERQTVHAIHVGIMQRTLGGAIPDPHPGKELCFVHDALK